MEYSRDLDFADLNESLRPRPRLSASEQLYCSLSRVPSKSARRKSAAAPRRSASFSEPEDDGPDPDGDSDSGVLARLSLRDPRQDDASDADADTDGAPQPARSESPASDGGDSPFQRSFVTLPDLIHGGRPLGRRRTLGHVNDTVSKSPQTRRKREALCAHRFGSSRSLHFRVCRPVR